MIVLFHAICFIFAELSTPVWQKEVRQITYQVVEALWSRGNVNGLDQTIVQEYFILRSIERCDQIYAIFSFPPGRFTSAASVVKK